jgi:hypothetical protein
LDNATSDANWGDFQVEWDPVITATTCTLLLSCGLTPDMPWHIERNGFVRCSLADSFRWLDKAIRPDGSFGTDFWDAAQCGILIEQFALAGRFSAYDSLRHYLLKTIDSRQFSADESQWQGPGFTAAAIDYLLATKGINQAEALATELLAAQTHRGCWHGSLDAGGVPIISPVWHTAQCVIALTNLNFHKHVQHSSRIAQSAARGLAWLKATQDPSGAWLAVHQYKIYVTAYAILALLCDKAKYEQELDQAIRYLKSKMGPDGKCSDLAGTLMCGLALKAAVGNEFQRDLTLVDFLLARKNLIRAEALSAELRLAKAEIDRQHAELESYEKKYGDADIVMTKRQMFVGTLVALFLTALGTVAGVYALNEVIPHDNGSHRPSIGSTELPVPPQNPPTVQPSHKPAPSMPARPGEGQPGSNR